MAKPRQYEIWLADLEPRFGTKAGKTRPVLVVQTNLLNKVHPSTLVCPITSKVMIQSEILRVHLPEGIANLDRSCDVMIDQVRAIDNRRLLRKIGSIAEPAIKRVKQNLNIIFDLDG
jgi:mRNA interferase MazF